MPNEGAALLFRRDLISVGLRRRARVQEVAARRRQMKAKPAAEA